MRLNGIFCTNYQAAERFHAVLRETSPEAIAGIDPSRLVVRTDDGKMVETYTLYNRLFSVRHIISEDVFEVEFATVPRNEIVAERMEGFLEGLKESVELDDRDFGQALGKMIRTAGDVASLVFVCLAQSGQLDDVAIAGHPELFPEWNDKWIGKAGDIVRDADGTLYRAVSDVGAGTGKNANPSDAPALWTKIDVPLTGDKEVVMKNGNG